MSQVIKIIRATVVGGLLFLVPFVVLLFILGRAFAIVEKLVEPIAKSLPVESVIGLRLSVLLAVAILVLVCFLAGFFARTAVARRLVSGLESGVLSNLPGYEFFKGLGEGLLGVEQHRGHQVVVARFDDNWQIGFLLERLENGMLAVFIPSAPNPHSGSVCYFAPDRITILEIGEQAAIKCLKRLGAGSNALLGALPVSSVPAGTARPQ